MVQPGRRTMALRLSVLGSLALIASAQDTTDCDVAVVGGGWAGVYFAYRSFSDRSLAADRICLFEASARIGGRTYSKHIEVREGNETEEFVIDVGAYRFSPDMHLPGDLILKKMKLETECYEPDCEPASKDFPAPFQFNYSAPLRRIVDPVTRQPSGYVTPLFNMVDEMRKAGVKVSTNMQLINLLPRAEGGAKLVFADASVVRAGTVLLNLPRSPTLNLTTFTATAGSRVKKMMECVVFDVPQLFKNFTPGRSLTKAYAFYQDAWWHNSLNKTSGQMPENAFLPLNTSAGIPIGIHFNDGPVHCKKPGHGCRGFLEVYYANNAESFFEDLRTSAEEPSGILSADAGPAARQRLQHLHSAVLEATGPLFKARSLAVPKDPPTMLVVGVWDRTGHGYTAPTKVYYSVDIGDTIDKACGVPGLTEDEYRDSMLAPMGPRSRVFMANNDWVATETMKFFGDWAEESLLQAERALSLLGVPRPQWLDSHYYAKKVAQFVPQPGASPIVV